MATRKGLSPSGLARRAGLDPTTFNPSKRIAGDGRPRWPSTESLAKVLEATGAPLAEFVALAAPLETDSAPPATSPMTVPFAGLDRVACEGYFDPTGNPIGRNWDEIPFPDLRGEILYALEVSGNALLPVYRDGDILVVAPDVPVRRGDRVIVKVKSGEVIIRLLHRRTARTVELHSLAPSGTVHQCELDSIEWIARIVWASQ
ncbi:S24 family peptidase [Polymorphum gilvum]|uniref:S24 family peptidase n=1 Tax=Polymorphum gilvum TaxID=991904 RepID=UPI001F5800F2|nr:helix-turn-helix transcriptional regulator [Polymorphum gilvum]